MSMLILVTNHELLLVLWPFFMGKIVFFSEHYLFEGLEDLIHMYISTKVYKHNQVQLWLHYYGSYDPI